MTLGLVHSKNIHHEVVEGAQAHLDDDQEQELFT